MKTFTYNNELYIRLIPSKSMFHSTMVHEVVNRGDIFAMRVSDQQFTVIPGKAQVEHSEHTLTSDGQYVHREVTVEDMRQAYRNGVATGKNTTELKFKAIKLEAQALASRIESMEINGND